DVPRFGPCVDERAPQTPKEAIAALHVFVEFASVKTCSPLALGDIRNELGNGDRPAGEYSSSDWQRVPKRSPRAPTPLHWFAGGYQLALEMFDSAGRHICSYE